VIFLLQCGVLAVRTFRNLIRSKQTTGVQVSVLENDIEWKFAMNQNFLTSGNQAV